MQVTYEKLSRELRRDIKARVDVCRMSRPFIKDITTLAAETLQGRKVATDFLVAAQSLPRVLETDDEGGSWLAEQWSEAIEDVLRFVPRDDDEPKRSRELLLKLQSRLYARADENVDALTELFYHLCRLCKGLYRDAWRAPELVVEFEPVHPGSRTQFDPYCINAETIREKGSAKIHLYIHLREFGPESYAALPRLLLHELIAHVPAGHASDENDNESPFAEGWMDWVAEYHFRKWISRLDPQMTDAIEFHGNHLGNTLATRPLVSMGRERGRSAAIHLSSWFDRNGLRGRGELRTARLGLELNVSCLPLSRKTSLTQMLHLSVPEPLMEPLRMWARQEVSADDVLRFIGGTW